MKSDVFGYNEADILSIVSKIFHTTPVYAYKQNNKKKIRSPQLKMKNRRESDFNFSWTSHQQWTPTEPRQTL